MVKRASLILGTILLVAGVLAYPYLRRQYAVRLYLDGVAESQQEHWPDAARCFEAAIRQDDSLAEAWHGLGVARYRMGKLESSMDAIKRELAIRPDDLDGFNMLGLAQLGLGQYEAARESAETILRLKPHSAGAYYILGGVYYHAGQMSEAISAYRQVVRYEPRNGSAHNDLAASLVALGQYKDAEREFRDCIRLKPSYADARLSLGWVLLVLGDVAGAAEQQKSLRTLDARASEELSTYINLMTYEMAMKGTNGWISQDERLRLLSRLTSRFVVESPSERSQ